MEINIEGVKIVLTQDQLNQIDKQRIEKLPKVEDINSIDVAEDILKNCIKHTKYFSSEFKRQKDWIKYQLETIIKAANFIDNGYKLYTPNFNNNDILNYLPYFKKSSSDWLLYCINGYSYGSTCSVGLYFKVEDTASLISKKHIELYIQYLQG